MSFPSPKPRFTASWRNIAPELLERVRSRVAQGRWELTASSWVETDKNMPSGESLSRHILYTKSYLSSLFGVDPASLDIDFSPDTFGHSENIPEIDVNGGVKYYYHCRGRVGDPILWRGADPLHRALQYNSEAGRDTAEAPPAGIRTGCWKWTVGRSTPVPLRYPPGILPICGGPPGKPAP